MSEGARVYDRRYDDRLTRLEVDVAVLKENQAAIKEDVRQSRTLLDASAERQERIFNAVIGSIITTLVTALAIVLWSIYTHPHGFA
jgi:cytochrome c-type biogenesis protein CcmH/NrfG